MPEITIATSIIPRNFELQRIAIDSWLRLGFKVISLNSADEAKAVTHQFPDIPIKIVDRSAEVETGKPYIYFDDVCAALFTEKSEVCGIINSDVLLRADYGFAEFVVGTVGNGLLFGSRLDVDSFEGTDGEKFIYGFDFFFFNREVLTLFPETNFCLGVPWWDYWAPLVPMLKGIPCKELISPIAFHPKHETKWAGELFTDYGRLFADKLTLLDKATSLGCRISTDSNPEQLTIFSFDVLNYILKNSDKVTYPSSSSATGLIEVGERQYLALREQVIEQHKKTIELHEHVARQMYHIQALQSSLSWRLTAPLRWLGDMMRR